jgi:uncharacterized protein (TIGR01777 family)
MTISPQHIAISGASGLLGSRLEEALHAVGHDVSRLVRRPAQTEHEISYDIEGAAVDVAALEPVDVIVHLAGENVGDGRWSPSKKERIRRSRVASTKLLASAFASCSKRPRAFISASAIGIYGARGDEILDEESAHGDGFLADVCVAWEAACNPAREVGIRVVNARIGVVVTTEGGALAKMLPPFKLGLGGTIGSGDQWVSWISLDDVVGALVHLAVRSSLRGPVNLVAPSPVTNRQMTEALGRHLGRPTVLPLPAFAARLAFGERADSLLLASAHVRPSRLAANGYVFIHPDIDRALSDALASGSGVAA